MIPTNISRVIWLCTVAEYFYMTLTANTIETNNAQILTSSNIGLYTTPTVGTFPMVRPMETHTKGNLEVYLQIIETKISNNKHNIKNLNEKEESCDQFTHARS